MIGSDVQKNGCVGTEIIHIVELKRANLDDIVCMWSLSNLQCEAFSYVSCKRNIVTCFFKDMVYQRSGSGFTITSCDTYHLRVGVSACKLNFADNRNIMFYNLFYHRNLFRNARTFNHFVCI